MPRRTSLTPQFNAAQQVILDKFWDERLKDVIAYGMNRPSKREYLSVKLECCRVGPDICSQDIGKHYANRAAAEEGRPRAVQKTPEQLALLQEVFDKDPRPTTLEVIRIVYKSGLSRKKVLVWFENQIRRRKKNGETLITHNDEKCLLFSRKLWEEFEYNRDRFIDKYFLRTDKFHSKEQIEENERLHRELASKNRDGLIAQSRWMPRRSLD